MAPADSFALNSQLAEKENTNLRYDEILTPIVLRDKSASSLYNGQHNANREENYPFN